MKRICYLIVLLLASYVGYAQSIRFVNPTEARRNEEVWFSIEGLNTHFTASSSLIISLKSNVDGSIININDVSAFGDNFCGGSITIPVTATTGKYAVSIITANEGTLTKTNGFTISNVPPVPELISVTPTAANNGEHVRLTIKARYAKFLSAFDIEVYVTGSTTYLTADSVVVLNDSMLSATVDIPVKNRSDLCGMSVYTNTDYINLWQCFMINGIDPEIVSITPNSASDGDHVDVTIKTTKTSFMSSVSLDVTLSGEWSHIVATSVTKVNDTVLVASFDIPVKTRTDICDVIIADDGNGIFQVGGFQINGIDPVITSINPANGIQGATLDVTITGEDMFFVGASYIDLSFYGVLGGFIPADSIVVLNDNQIKTTLKLTPGTPAGLYQVNLSVDGNSASFEEYFTVVDDGMPDPELVSITPNEVTRGQVLDVIITGVQTLFTQASNIRVALIGNGYFEASSTVIVSNTILKSTFDIPSGASLGLYSVYVFDANNNMPMILVDGFTIKNNPTTDPELVSISPAMTFPGQTLDVTITGSKTHFMAASGALDLYIFSPSDQISATSYTATSNTTMNARFEIPLDFPLGVYDFGVGSQLDGWMILPQSVIINAVGLDEQEEKFAVKLYPNPVTDKLYLETETHVTDITILDLTGRQIPIGKNDSIQNANQYTISLDQLGLKKGIYFIRLTSDSGSAYQKFVLD